MHYLNARHELIHKEIVSIGTVNASIVDPRDSRARDTAQCHRCYCRSQPPKRRRDAIGGGQRGNAPAEGGRRLLGISMLQHIIITEYGYTTL